MTRNGISEAPSKSQWNPNGYVAIPNKDLMNILHAGRSGRSWQNFMFYIFSIFFGTA
jgi:hypothetical protein